jgi:endonuclease-3
MARESRPLRQIRARRVVTRLKRAYPKAGIVLRYSNHWQLLVAVILSAQCTDKKVNEVTAVLFQHYPSLDDYLTLDRRELERLIRPTGFYRAKAKNILAAARVLDRDFNGRLPTTIAQMVELPGVARKTANVVLGNAHGLVEGIAVDTHVGRLSRRLGFSRQTDPVKVERDLMALVPQRDWFGLTYLLIDHGRAVCTAKKPACDRCVISASCPAAFRFPHFRTGKKAPKK